MLGGRWGEKWRNRQGLIWGAQSPLAAQFNGARRASEAVTLLELSDLNKEVFALQGRVGCLLVFGGARSLSRNGEAWKLLWDPPHLWSFHSSVRHIRKLSYPTRSATALSTYWVCLEQQREGVG